MVNQKVAARLQVGPNCLLFFIDETGHETFADKNYPVFGLGGCAINSSSAAAVVAEPWRAMEAAHFGGEDVLLHANELRNPTTEQLDALSKFFREQQFARLAVTMSKSAVLPTGKTPLVRNHHRFDDEPVHGFAEARLTRAERGGIPA
jgi:hypothetical protein